MSPDYEAILQISPPEYEANLQISPPEYEAILQTYPPEYVPNTTILCTLLQGYFTCKIDS